MNTFTNICDYKITHKKTYDVLNPNHFVKYRKYDSTLENKIDTVKEIEHYQYKKGQL